MFPELQTRNLQQFERSGVHSLPAVTRGSVGHQTMQHGRSAGQPPTAAASSSSSSDRSQLQPGCVAICNEILDDLLMTKVNLKCIRS